MDSRVHEMPMGRGCGLRADDGNIRVMGMPTQLRGQAAIPMAAGYQGALAARVGRMGNPPPVPAHMQLAIWVPTRTVFSGGRPSP